MASTYGDPLEEARYNKWKKSMMRVTQQNPDDESRPLPNGAEILNSTIFRHMSDAGMSLRQLEVLIPASPASSPEYLGELYGGSISIDHTGRLLFNKREFGAVKTVVAAEDIEEGQMVVLDEPIPTCDHGFVVRDVEGENRFLCKECDVRFPRHPSMMEKGVIAVHSSPVSINNTLSLFREGMLTFSNAAKETTLSIEKFREAMANLFPPEVMTDTMYTIGEPQPKVVNLGEGPKRVSCYKKVEDVFGNPNVTVEQINQFGNPTSIFPDVTEVRHVMDERSRIMIVEIHFIDGSKQRVEIPEKELMMRKSSLAPKSRSHADYLNGEYRRG